jgi:hypothetical protein
MRSIVVIKGNFMFIFRLETSNMLGQAEYVARMRETGNEYSILAGKPL